MNSGKDLDVRPKLSQRPDPNAHVIQQLGQRADRQRVF
jgi:hypothetical protein